MAPSELKDMTLAVCDIAKSAGSYIREERKKFSLQEVERKHAHDYVSYVDKGSIKDPRHSSLLNCGDCCQRQALSLKKVQPVTIVNSLCGSSILSTAPPTSSISMLPMLSVSLLCKARKLSSVLFMRFVQMSVSMRGKAVGLT